LTPACLAAEISASALIPLAKRIALMSASCSARIGANAPG
jgi:hypothetical protein